MSTAILKQRIKLDYLGYSKSAARADVRIYDVAGKPVILISQPRDGYTGLSVTNGIERIVTNLHHGFNIPTTATFIEHYPAQDDSDRRNWGKPSFDLVTFTWCNYRLAAFLPLRYSATTPKWGHLGQKAFSELTGLDPEEV